MVLFVGSICFGAFSFLVVEGSNDLISSFPNNFGKRGKRSHALLALRPLITDSMIGRKEIPDATR
jgi:hypothetical protein